MCKWGTESVVVIEGKSIEVDACIAEELIFLNDNGVKTVASCCGHGKHYPNALILSSSKRRAKELGYFPIYYTFKHADWGRYQLPLKGRCFNARPR